MEKNILGGALDLLEKQNFNENWELIMVDDASTDNSKDIIKKSKFKI